MCIVWRLQIETCVVHQLRYTAGLPSGRKVTWTDPSIGRSHHHRHVIYRRIPWNHVEPLDHGTLDDALRCDASCNLFGNNDSLHKANDQACLVL